MIYLSFGDNGEMRSAEFDFDSASMHTIVATLDARNVAAQASIAPEDVDNGGNAAMYGTVIATL